MPSNAAEIMSPLVESILQDVQEDTHITAVYSIFAGLKTLKIFKTVLYPSGLKDYLMIL